MACACFDGSGSFMFGMEALVEAEEVTFGRSPFEGREGDFVGIEPCSFAGFVSVVTLFDAAGPAALPVCDDPGA